MLSVEEYTTMNDHRADFESLIKNQFCRNLDISWIRKMSDVYQRNLNAPPVNVSCKACISDAMHKVWNLMMTYEAEMRKREQELKEKESKESERKRVGRQPKNWLANENKNA